MGASTNFRHLPDPTLVQHALRAERFVFEDPGVALIKLRQLGEGLAQQVAARTGLFVDARENQADLLRRLRDRQVIDREVADLFHALRKAGNEAVHGAAEAAQRDALHHLRLAWRLGVWFQRAFVDPDFRSGAFVPPADPAVVGAALAQELADLRRQAAESAAQIALLASTVEGEAARRAAAEAAAARAQGEAEAALELAEATEAEKLAAEARLAALQAQATPVTVEAVLKQVKAAELELDEAETRLLIDAQLRAAGWEADSVALRHSAGALPEPGKFRAIAEWPTTSGPADYVLFAGTWPVGVVEAKRKRKDVSEALNQSRRYSQDYLYKGPEEVLGPWGDGDARGKWKVPFLYATNGRPFLPQLRMKSGIWFADARRSTNLPRPLDGWHDPQTLLRWLAEDVQVAEAKLAAEPLDLLPLRDYQRRAIQAVEAALARGQRDLLVAMATGTGKTRLALALIYRLIKAKRFHRVLFLVDRTALGDQALEAFTEVRLEQQRTFADIYDVKTLGDLAPEKDTKLHVATVQSMLNRLEAGIAVDTYDCLVVDECHRGYALDREMGEGELAWRSHQEYLSQYRRVIDHFDAVRIGLTATPALHTAEIFGDPVFEYSFRDAVSDEYLVPFDPPFRPVTQLKQAGIHWAAGDEVLVLHRRSQKIERRRTPDNIDIEIDGFNTRVVTESFNRVVCTWLATQIDPKDKAKTLVFCATDAHAELVVQLLKEAFAAQYGEVEHDAVEKITAAAHKPDAKLRCYKNEPRPSVAVTVDLLTTGIDVPEITHLVFLRRVKSRVLFEQMLGRATRLCPEIEKKVFFIYDPVDLFKTLQDHTDMQPAVARPSVSHETLVEEICTVPDEAFRQSSLDELVARVRRRRKRLLALPEGAFEALAGESVGQVIDRLRKATPAQAAEWLAPRGEWVKLLDRLPGDDVVVPIHEGPDEFVRVERGFGDGVEPADYLASFRAFIEQNQNQIDALRVVTTRPRELTRAQLKALKRTLDQAGFSERFVQTAVQVQTNQDIAASIIGFIRQQVLREPLVPYAQRVQQAVQKVLASQPWTPPQRKWLVRIGQQLEAETVVDREAFDQGQFGAEGGFERLNRQFDGRLLEVLGALQDAMWPEVA